MWRSSSSPTAVFRSYAVDEAELLRTRLGGAYQDETALQDHIERLLSENNTVFTREYIISPRDRIDFILADGTGIEVKVAGSVTSLNRQLVRYAENDCIQRLIIVTTKRTHLPGMLRKIGEITITPIIVSRGFC